jgi:hypothetical protein
LDDERTSPNHIHAKQHIESGITWIKLAASDDWLENVELAGDFSRRECRHLPGSSNAGSRRERKADQEPVAVMIADLRYALERDLAYRLNIKRLGEPAADAGSRRTGVDERIRADQGPAVNTTLGSSRDFGGRLYRQDDDGTNKLSIVML